MLQKIETSMTAAPVALPQQIDRPQDWVHRLVDLSGHFLNDRPFLIQPRTHEGRSGYHLFVPFRRTTGEVVFVNRGWVKKEGARAVKPVDTFTRLRGTVRLPRQGFFTPDNDPSQQQWYWPDISAMAQSAGLSNVSAFAVYALPQALAGASDPIAIAPLQDIPNNHRSYAFFWYGMAGILTIIYFIFHLQPIREPQHG